MLLLLEPLTRRLPDGRQTIDAAWLMIRWVLPLFPPV